MDFNAIPAPVVFGLFLWSLFWKGLALWHAAKLGQKNWFVVMLILNAAGIVEIVYLFFFAKKRFDYHTLLFWKK